MKNPKDINTDQTCLSIRKKISTNLKFALIRRCRPENDRLHAFTSVLGAQFNLPLNNFILRDKLDHQSTVISYEGKTISEQNKNVLFYLNKEKETKTYIYMLNLKKYT